MKLMCGFLKKSGRRWWPEMDFIFLRCWQPLLILFEFIKTSRPAFVEKANCSVGFWPASVDHCFIYSKTSIPFLRHRRSVWIMWGFWQVFLGLCLNSAEISALRRDVSAAWWIEQTWKAPQAAKLWQAEGEILLRNQGLCKSPPGEKPGSAPPWVYWYPSLLCSPNRKVLPPLHVAVGLQGFVSGCGAHPWACFSSRSCLFRARSWSFAGQQGSCLY